MALTNESAHVRRVVIACQGGASHTAFTAGALKQIFHSYAEQSAARSADRYRIIGLSGTSGGAICAFLAWYGLITGGPSRAAHLIDTFWSEGIAARTFLEDAVLQQGGLQLLRTPWSLVSQTLAKLLCAPYVFEPQLVMDTWATWHVGPLADLIAPRPEHVNVEKLFAKCDAHGQPLVSTVQLEQIGDLQRTLQQISKILSELHVLPDYAKNPGTRLIQIQSLARQARHLLGTGLIEKDLRSIVEAQLNNVMNWQADADFAAGRRKFVQPLPTLLLGAVDVLSGTFKAFDSRKGEISIQAVLASTILPELFKARTIGNQEYWDGLYSENPPVRGFVAFPDEPDEKPDEIWLVKIDPLERLTLPTCPAEIEDRRNELAGDLSLNQELSAIESMNQWLSKLNVVSRRKYKHITIERMQLDETAVQQFVHDKMDVPSKMYRGRTFILGLMAHGADQARAFLPVVLQKARLRRFIERGWNGLMDGSVTEIGNVATFAPNHTLVSCSKEMPGAPGDAVFIGPEGVQQFIAELRNHCLNKREAEVSPQKIVVSDFYVTINDLIVAACDQPASSGAFLAASRWTLRGVTPEEPPDTYVDDRPPQRSVKIQGIWVSRIVGDQFLESWVWDTRGITPQARLMIPPDPGARSCRRTARVLVQHWLEDGWKMGNLDLVDECFATDYVHNDCGYFPEICDRATYKAWLRSCSPRSDLTIEQLFAEGDRVVALLRWAGGQLGVVIFRVAGGAIQESWWTWDTQRLLV